MTETAPKAEDVTADNVTGDELRQFIERVERLEEERAAIQGDIKEVKAELKGRGFDVKVFNEILRIRKMDHAERQEHQAVLELYMQHLGMV